MKKNVAFQANFLDVIDYTAVPKARKVKDPAGPAFYCDACGEANCTEKICMIKTAVAAQDGPEMNERVKDRLWHIWRGHVPDRWLYDSGTVMMLRGADEKQEEPWGANVAREGPTNADRGWFR